MINPTPPKYHLFVYGTLMSGFWNNRLLENAVLLSKNAQISAVLIDLGGIPGVVYSDDGDDLIVKGELYEVDPITIERCDRLEGYREHAPHDSMYVREYAVVNYLDGDPDAFQTQKETQAFFYRWNRGRNRDIIKGGCFREHYHQTNSSL